MATLNIFVSFAFKKDKSLKNGFYKQAKKHTKYRILNCSLNERYPDDAWKRKAKEAVEGCDVVVVLIGQDTHNAPGIIAETDMARSLRKPVIQIKPQESPYNGLTRLEKPILWDWDIITARLDEISPAKR